MRTLIAMALCIVMGYQNAAGQTKVVPNSAVCVGCAIKAQTVVTLQDKTASALIESIPTELIVDRQGRYWLIGPHGIHVYDARGQFVKALARKGSGPGEFESTTRAALLPGDSVLIFDNELARASVFGPDLRYARSIRTPRLVTWQATVINWPNQILINGLYESTKRLGWPLHIASFATSEMSVQSSFGLDNGDYTIGTQKYMRMRFGPTSQGETWVADQLQYRLAKWTADGRAAEVLLRRPDWFQSRSDGLWGGPQKPPSPEMTAVGVDGGLIWAVASRARSDFARAYANMPAAGGVGMGESSFRQEPSDLFVSSVDVIEPATMRLMASTTLEGVTFDALPGNRFGVYDIDASGEPVVRVLKLTLVGR